MDSMIDSTVNDCIACQCNEDNTTTEPILPSTIPESAWHTLSIDFGSRSPTNDYTLAVYDSHSRKTLVKLAPNMTTATAIRICQNFFIKYGIPKIIKSDNGPAFISAEWANFAKKYNFHHQKITPLHPEANSGDERVMKATNKRIRVSKVAKTHWKTELSKYLHRYNQTPHSATGFSPNMLLLGHDDCDILPNIRPRTLNENIRKLAIANDGAAKQRMKRYADLYQHVKHREFNLKDPVLHAWDRTNKFQPLFDQHPYRVSAKKGTMITATRSDHQITRNSNKFKIISEKCYAAAMKLVGTKTAAPTPMRFAIYPRQELIPYVAPCQTPPQTPAQQQVLNTAAAASGIFAATTSQILETPIVPANRTSLTKTRNRSAPNQKINEQSSRAETLGRSRSASPSTLTMGQPGTRQPQDSHQTATTTTRRSRHPRVDYTSMFRTNTKRK